MKKILVFVIAIFLISIAAAAGVSYETGKAGLIVKNVKCDLDTWAEGVLINRTSELIKGVVEVSILDTDGDFLWRGTTPVNVGPQNGQNLSVKVNAGKCKSPNRMAFRFLD